MKNMFKFLVLAQILFLFFSCSTDQENTSAPPNIQMPPVSQTPQNNYLTNPFFWFLDGDGSSNTYINMPIESSSENLLIGRWKFTKQGIDENNDGNIKYYNYLDYNHHECGLSFLQFNNNGVVFENSYYNNNGNCKLYSEIDDFELFENGRIKIYVYDNIYILKATQSELILKYDWNFENSLYGPAQTYYHFERILPPN